MAKKTTKKVAKKAAKKTTKKTAKKTTKKTAKKTAKKADAESSDSESTFSKSGKSLLIVESQAKAKTIKKFLGRNFTVKASIGHVRDIPSKGRGKKAFGIDFDNGFKPIYEPIKGREKVLGELADAASKADTVYLAPDPDREGEAIAWHLKEALHLPESKTKRVTFNSITKSAVQEAMENPRAINMDLVDAQQSRRVLDRLVGFSLSPFLWRKVTKGLSAGRVQSVAVRIVVEREAEIQAFIKEEFWRIMANISKDSKQIFSSKLVSWDGEKFDLGTKSAETEESANAIADTLRKADFKVTDITERKVSTRPTAPFITSTLQQAASTHLRYDTSKTMRVAQQLYEGQELDGKELTGLITYMRTDSTRVAPEAIKEVRGFIKDKYDAEYLPAKANTFGKKKGSQDAHEAVRPASVLRTPEMVKPFLTKDQYKLYDLIWRRFVASQMASAIFQTTTVSIAADKGILEAKGRRVVFDGHTVLGAEAVKRTRKKDEEKDDEESESKTEDQLLPKLEEGDALKLKDLEATQHYTQPPARFSEASLVRALEKEGIGRPSTYAPIVKTIQDRGYVRRESRRFHATELGIAVTDILLRGFKKIMQYKFTAGMEADLDKVEEGKIVWSELIAKFYGEFEKQLAKAGKEIEPIKGQPAPNGEKCPLCEADMVIRYSRSGAFLGCTKYPDCKGLSSMPGADGQQAEDYGEVVPCPKCVSPMIKKRSRFGDFLACSSYPACNQTLPLGKDGQPVELPEIKMDCHKCGKEMIVKMGRRGPFLACSGYPDCKNTKHIDREGKVIELPDIGDMPCDKCGTEMVVRMSRRGPFIACSGFPKCRNTKSLPKKEGEEDAKDDKKADKKADSKAEVKADDKAEEKTEEASTE